MSRSFCVFVSLLCLSCLGCIVSANPNDHPDRVTSLPGLQFAPSFAYYSGYFNVPNSPKMLHYVFTESAGNPGNDPVVLWLNGGPGCSSMLGLFTENGPFRLSEDASQVTQNLNAWNNYANMLYLEAPSGVGFSYGTNNNYTSTDITTADDNYAFLVQFFQEYSEFSTNRFYITGESFAGNYVLELAQVIAHANADIKSRLEIGQVPDQSLIINLSGIQVGNPTMNWVAGANAYLPFMAYHGMIAAADLQKAYAICNGTFEPPPTPACGQLVGNLSLNFYDINPYNVEALCKGEGWGSQPGCFTMDALNALSRPSTTSGHSREKLLDELSKTRPLSQTFVPCIDLYPIRTFLNSPAVMEALHIASTEVVLPWDACSQVLNYGGIIGNMIPIYEDLLANTTIRILIYSGDVDSCVPYLGTEETVMQFPYVSKTPLKDAWQSWHYVSTQAPSIEQVGGKFMQWAERLAYATVRGAGHMVPTDAPEAALQLFYSFLNDPTEMNLKKVREPTLYDEQMDEEMSNE